MTIYSWLQLFLYLIILLLLVKPLGSYMAHVFQEERTFISRAGGPVERFVYRITGVIPDDEMGWLKYALVMLLFNLLGFVLLYAIMRLQAILPWNPQHLSAVPPSLSFNTAISFITNTNWQFYAGETTMSYFTQMVGLTVQNFLSAATGIAILIAIIRGLSRHSAKTLGNYWVDMTRSIVYVLLPLSFIFAIVLVSQGVVQTLHSAPTANLLQSAQNTSGQVVSQQVISVGPVASQEAIKMLGTNGGGFFNTNSAHPFENPTPLTDFLEMLAILLIPAALVYTYGKMVRDTRQGWALLAAMTIIFVLCVSVTVWAEQNGNPALVGLNINQTASNLQPGGNMEGKEVRFGIVNSALWADVTTAASNGSVNSMHDSFTPLGGLFPLWLMELGEIIFGGVGSGLYGMLAHVIIAVFVAGLMIGRTPEYLGKKIEAFEMKMAALIVLTPVVAILLGTAIAVAIPAGRATIFNPGAQGFSEVLYAFSSASNNNGSAFAGLGSNTFYNIATGIAMLLGRYWTAIPALAIGGALVKKKRVPVSSGTLPTHTPLFVFWLMAVFIIIGALSFFPALSLGPVVEQLMSR